MTAIEWVLLVSLSLLWGGSFFFVGVAVESLPPLTIVTLRVGIAALILLMIVVARGIALPRSRKVWAAFLGMGFLNNVIPFSLIVWGQSHIASGLASILNATTPIFTFVIIHWVMREGKAKVSGLVGTLLGFAGVALMLGKDLGISLDVDIVAQFAILGAALSYAVSSIYGRRFKALDIDPMQTAAGQLTASTLMLIPFTLYIDQPWHYVQGGLGIEVVASMLALAIFSTALAYILYFKILATAGASNLMLVTFLIPVSAVILGTVFLDERLLRHHYAGMLLILIALIIIDGRIHWRSSSRHK